jgi:hypothetical protein
MRPSDAPRHAVVTPRKDQKEGDMTAPTLYRFAAGMLVVSAVTITGGRVLHPAVDHAGLTSAVWAPAHWLWLAGLLTGMVGVIGLYLRQRERIGVAGFFGAASAWTGMGMMSGAIYFEAVVQPGLIGHAPQLVDSFVAYEGMGAFLPVFLASVVLFGLGFLVFGITMIRVGILPAWAAGLLIIGSVIGGPQGLLPPVIAYGAMFALGIGLVGLAYALWASVPDAGGDSIPVTRPSSAPNTSP